MNHSESLVSIAPAIVALQGEMKAVAKTADNPFFHSKYADLAGCMAALQSPCLKNGLAILQAPSTVAGSVIVTTTIMHKSGEWISTDASATPKDLTPQSVGSAITYLRRYGLALVGLVTDDDDDGNQAQGGNKTTQAPAQPSKASPNAQKPAKEPVGAQKAPVEPLPPLPAIAPSGNTVLTVPALKELCSSKQSGVKYEEVVKFIKKTWNCEGLTAGQAIAEHSDEIRLYWENDKLAF